MNRILLGLLPAAAFAICPPAAAQMNTLNNPAPGYSSLMSADYASAVREIRSTPSSAFDAGRSINMGVALAKSGDMAGAQKEFRSVLMNDNVAVVVFNGQTLMSHDVARNALAAMQGGVLSR